MAHLPRMAVIGLIKLSAAKNPAPIQVIPPNAYNADNMERLVSLSAMYVVNSMAGMSTNDNSENDR